MASKQKPKKSYDSKRYTAPGGASDAQSDRTVTIVMLTLFAVGFGLLAVRYLGMKPSNPKPGDENKILIFGPTGIARLGLAFIVSGFLAATYWKGDRSRIIVPAVMFGLFFLGVAVIVLNYFDNAPLLPGPSSQGNLLIGLGLLTGGFVASTQWR